jgi:hypothetical protein
VWLGDGLGDGVLDDVLDGVLLGDGLVVALWLGVALGELVEVVEGAVLLPYDCDCAW